MMVGSGKDIRGAEGGRRREIKKKDPRSGNTHQPVDTRIFHEHLVKATYGGEEDDRVHVIEERNPGSCTESKKNYSFVSPTHPHTHNSGGPENEGGFFFRHDKTTL